MYRQTLKFLSRNKLKFNLKTPEQLENLYSTVKVDHTKAMDRIVEKCKTEAPTFKNAIDPMLKADNVLNYESTSIMFPNYVHPDKDIRTASATLTEQLQEYFTQLSMNKDIYDIYKSVKESEYDQLNDAQKRVIDKTIEAFEKVGMTLKDKDRQQLEELTNKINKLCLEFSINLANNDVALKFTEAELEGGDKKWIKGLKKCKETGKRIIDKPQFVEALTNVHSEIVRKEIAAAQASMCNKENLPLLQKALAYREKKAKLLGYDTWADYKLKYRMAKSPQRVYEFLNRLYDTLQDQSKEELKDLLELKDAEIDAGSTHYLPNNEEDLFKAHDIAYWFENLKSQEFGVDNKIVKQYFPCNHVVKECMNIYQELLSLKFVEVDVKDNTWHESSEEVRLFEVYDTSSNKLLGQFYLDLYPRESKYTHFAAFPLQYHCDADESNEEQFGITAMVCNFPRATKADPHALLSHNDVITFFHEFGHVLHGVTSQTTYHNMSGTQVVHDFVEVPSQAFERWCWDKDMLKRLSNHYETGKPLPDELIQNMIDSRNLGIATRYIRQIIFSLIDLDIHSIQKPQSLNLNDMSNSLYEEMTGIRAPHPKHSMLGNFAHLMAGYDVGYYGYAWAETHCVQVFDKFKRQGDILNPELGKRLRETILSVGNERDPETILVEFLEEELALDAFLKEKGVFENYQQLNNQ
mmetsp:Transcript_10231/g.14980  ORF Transcript_10231/g.14980 Transcript_10231/m.14980 type:complete len:693 (+) Transcript_10231:76-2154(+)